jgi:hypothetical protein
MLALFPIPEIPAVGAGKTLQLGRVSANTSLDLKHKARGIHSIQRILKPPADRLISVGTFEHPAGRRCERGHVRSSVRTVSSHGSLILREMSWFVCATM